MVVEVFLIYSHWGLAAFNFITALVALNCSLAISNWNYDEGQTLFLRTANVLCFESIPPHAHTCVCALGLHKKNNKSAWPFHNMSLSLGGSFPATWSQFCCCSFHATFRSELVAVVYILPPAANLSLPCFLTGDQNLFLDENPWFPDSSLCLCFLYGCLLQTDTRPHLLKSKSLLIVR